MFNIPAKLAALDSSIRVGLIGAGVFGSRLVNQIRHVPGMEIAAIADIDEQKAVETFRGGGVPADAITVGQSPSEVEAAIENTNKVVLSDGMNLAEADVDVIVEATGNAEVGASHAFTALMNGKHVVMANVEADSVVGPVLAELAENNGVTYSLAYGDQPAVTVELVDWARTSGFEVVAAGRGIRKENHYCTPDNVFDFLGLDEAFVTEHDLNPQMYTTFLDGTKSSVEMCSIANAAGLRVDSSGMHKPIAEIPEIPEKFKLKEDGGLLSQKGVADVIQTEYPDGTRVEQDISFGQFVVTTTTNQPLREYLEERNGSGWYVSDAGKYHVFYRPFHLAGTETSVSIASAVLRNEPTGTAKSQNTEVIGKAKRDLESGEAVDGPGGFTVYGQIEDRATANEAGLVPYELLKGAEVVADVEKDSAITYDDVSVETDSFIYSLRNIQNEYKLQ